MAIFLLDLLNLSTYFILPKSTAAWIESRRELYPIKEALYIFGKTDKLIKKPNYDNYSFENLTKWWKVKAQKRWENVKANGKLRRELEFWNADNIDKLDIIR